MSYKHTGIIYVHTQQYEICIPVHMDTQINLLLPTQIPITFNEAHVILTNKRQPAANIQNHHTHTLVHTHLHPHTHIHTLVHTHTHLDTHTHLYTNTHTHTHKVPDKQTYMHRQADKPMVAERVKSGIICLQHLLVGVFAQWIVGQD